MVPGVWRFSIILFALTLATVSGGNEPDNSSGSNTTTRYQSRGRKRKEGKGFLFFPTNQGKERWGGM